MWILYHSHPYSLEYSPRSIYGSEIIKAKRSTTVSAFRLMYGDCFRDFCINTTKLNELPSIPKTQMVGATYLVQISPNVCDAESGLDLIRPHRLIFRSEVVLFSNSMARWWLVICNTNETITELICRKSFSVQDINTGQQYNYRHLKSGITRKFAKIVHAWNLDSWSW